MTDNSRQPLVSFIVTCYNLPTDMLCECIDSILKLNLETAEREIIVVDDGSEVSPMNDLLKYGDDIIYVRQKNNGVSVARNTALAMAQGQYIQLVDGDDYLLTAPYDYCLDLIRNCSQVDVVMFDFTHDAGKASDSFIPPIIKNGPDLLRTENIRGAACCCLFRQAVRGQLTFTPGIAYGEDEEFTPQLILHGRQLFFTDAKAYVYRKNKKSITHKKGVRSKVKMLSDNLEAIKSLKAVNVKLPPNEQQAMQRRIDQLTMDYIYNVIIKTHSRHYLDRKLNILRREGLFPLPDKKYTTKYKWFRRLTNSEWGLNILLRMLPLLKKER